MAKRKKIRNGLKNGSSETGAVLEYIEDQVKIIAEQTSRLPNIEDKMGRMEEAMEVMKMDIELIQRLHISLYASIILY